MPLRGSQKTSEGKTLERASAESVSSTHSSSETYSPAVRFHSLCPYRESHRRSRSAGKGLSFSKSQEAYILAIVVAAFYPTCISKGTQKAKQKGEEKWKGRKGGGMGRWVGGWTYGAMRHEYRSRVQIRQVTRGQVEYVR
jgi:hypothetical protein